MRKKDFNPKEYFKGFLEIEGINAGKREEKRVWEQVEILYDPFLKRFLKKRKLSARGF